ncbi:unnamed protein product [Mycena citricolor]|uniref:Uncharacterized protein n=1 Tax=Mycena citricolor TaxID=2018698 RepID=A0AAD2H8W1_9AGAR|nr:unnamed protein product [Mycena citricolor]
MRWAVRVAVICVATESHLYARSDNDHRTRKVGSVRSQESSMNAGFGWQLDTRSQERHQQDIHVEQCVRNRCTGPTGSLYSKRSSADPPSSQCDNKLLALVIACDEPLDVGNKVAKLTTGSVHHGIDVDGKHTSRTRFCPFGRGHTGMYAEHAYLK